MIVVVVVTSTAVLWLMMMQVVTRETCVHWLCEIDVYSWLPGKGGKGSAFNNDE